MARWGREDEYREFLELIDLSFGFEEEERKFIRLLPKLYIEKCLPSTRNAVAVRDGRLVCAVGCYPGRLIAGDKELPFFGIGNVATHPDHRGLGLMRECMDFCLDEMIASGAVFSVLGGQRQRYAYFGYDRFGQVLTFHFNSQNILHCFGSKPREASLSLVPLEAGMTGELEEIRELYKAQPYRAEKDDDGFFDILSSWFNRPFVLKSGGETVGFAVLGDESPHVSEFVLKDGVDLRDLILCMSSFAGGGDFSLELPPFAKEYCDICSGIAEDFTVRHNENLAIFRYRDLIDALLTYKAGVAKLEPGRLVMLIHGFRADERIRVEVSGNGVQAEYTDEPADIEIGHIEATALLGAIYSPLRSGSSLLSSWFPLPFFLADSDRV